MGTMPRVCVVGLDGARWDLIMPWIERGELPHLRMIREQGAYGVLRSQLPPVTFPNWKCYSTGKQPGKLGVYWFEVFDREKRCITVPSAQNFSSAELWDYLNAAQIKTGVVNMPTTFPPRAIDGFMIAGGPLCGETGITYPPELEQELRTAFGYRRGMHCSADALQHGEPAAIDEALELIEMRFRVALTLWKRYSDLRFLHITIFYSNVLQHHFYRDLPVLRAWKIIDRSLGELMKVSDTVFLVSDHGCDKMDRVFYINTWLQREGYLTLKRPALKTLFDVMRCDKKTVRQVAQRMGLYSLLRRIVPVSMQRMVPCEQGRYKKKNEYIDWDKTTAFASAQGILYVTLPRESKDYAALRNELMHKLRTLTVPGTRTPVTKHVYAAEEVYTNVSSPVLMPDIVFEQGEGIHTNGDVGGNVLFDVPRRWKAENVPGGLFAAYGADIKKGYLRQGTSIMDIAPTILHYMGVRVPNDMDGCVMRDVLVNGSPREQHPVVYQEPIRFQPSRTERCSSDDDKIFEQLRQLGYVE